MAQGAAAPFVALFHDPGNPQLPVLPNPSDPKEGIVDPFAEDSASITQVAFAQNVLSIFAGAPGPARGFAQAYLNGIGGTPNPVDWGNITATKTRTITVHNTHRFPVEVQTVDVSAVSGVTLIDPGLPVSVPSFGSVVFTFEAGLAGDPTVDGAVIFNHDLGLFAIQMVGRRVIIFNTIPQRPITEQVTFGTDVMVSSDGTEQVMGFRTTPRSDVKFLIRHTDDEERTRLLNDILGAAFLLQGVQAWWQASRVTAPALAAATVVQVDTEGMEIAAFDTMSVSLPDRSAFQFEVLSFDAVSITASDVFGTDIVEDSYIMPIRFGFQSNKADLNTFAVGAEDLSVRFLLHEYRNIGNVDPAFFDAHPTDGLPIPKADLFFDGRARGQRITSAQERLDGGTGTIFQQRSQLLGRPGQAMLVHSPDRATTFAWRTFIHAQRGSWGEFYVPTGTNDLPLVPAGFTLGGNSFDVPNMGIANLIQNVAPRRDLKLVLEGVEFFRRITSVVDNGATERVTLDGVVTGAGIVQPEDATISWLTLCRMVGDSVTFKHVNRNVAEIRFSIRGVMLP